MDDAAAWEFYNDPANRTPAEGPVYRRRPGLLLRIDPAAQTWTGNPPGSIPTVVV